HAGHLRSGVARASVIGTGFRLAHLGDRHDPLHHHASRPYDRSAHDGAPLDPERLPISEKLRTRLARWCNQFQRSFENEIDLEAFAAEGRAIARAVKAELPDWSIVYFDEAEAARAKYQGAPARFEMEIQ